MIMKKIYLFAAFIASISLSMLGLYSCDADAEFATEAPVNPVMRPVISLTAMEQEDIFEAVVDDKARTVMLEVEPWTDLSNITVNMNIAKRAKLISPSSPEGVWDLTQPVKVIVNNIEKDITYTVTAKKKSEFIEEPLVSLIAKAGGETITAEINQVEQTIKMNFGPWVDLSETAITIEVKPHVGLVNPATKEVIWDFSSIKTKDVVVYDVQKEVTYRLTVTQTELESVPVAHTNFKKYRLDNDANDVSSDLGLGTSDFAKLFDNRYMSSPSDYDAVGWSPFACQPNNNPEGAALLTMDAGKMMYLAKFSAHRYWNEANTQVTKFDIYGYCQDGEPAKDGSWDGWTLLGSYSYNPAAPGNFAEGDCITVAKAQANQARYYRVNAKETWFIYSGNPSDWRAHVYSFTEFRFWEYR